ncbi:hypothetical protein K5I29_02830 [Flavobacterium agricola]|uniref:Tetratricopeptide repeat protein n=1 Tax=Flavobacterium agricola TaxID=2870839 RepID=A0ABY6M348_9FLAO|nr:hypothetical protein [Flavobacterium agricola]UYW01870.1 hypothetical protein K5I29_02830 [Flavobacterium agricola]
MVVLTRVEQLQDCLTQLKKALAKNKKSDPSIINLGNRALFLLDELLSENPYDFKLRLQRVQLNSDWLFHDYESVYKDAEFIVNQAPYNQHKLEGYTWMQWVVAKKAAPINLIQLLENKLIDIHLIAMPLHQKDAVLASTFYDLAKAYLEINQESYAYQLLGSSFLHDPYSSDRNLYLGLYFLKQQEFKTAEMYLWFHFLWANHTSKTKILKYGVILNQLYENQQINNAPNLIALLFAIIRNNKTSFGCITLPDFYNKYGDKLKYEAARFPSNSKLQAVLANTYFLDFQKYEKAFCYYQQMLAGDDPYFQSYVVRYFECAKLLHAEPENLLGNHIPELKPQNAISQYYIGQHLYDLYFETQNEAFLKKAELYVKSCYDVMSAYFKNNQGSGYFNSLVYYDCVCYLYGQILTTYAQFSEDAEQQQLLLICAASVY